MLLMEFSQVQIVTSNSDAKLLELVRALRGDPSDNYALHFKLSKLFEENRSDFQLKIAVNVLNDIFRESDGSIFLCHDGDVMVVYHGGDRTLLDKAIFQLRYLFIDDPLASNEDGSENEEFSDMWDLGFQWRPFNRLCQNRIDFMGKEDMEMAAKEVKRPSGMVRALDPEGLINVMDRLENIDLGQALRSQPICASSSNLDIKPLFNETYVNITHLSNLLGINYNLLSDKNLFKYITHHLDNFVLDTLSENPDVYLAKPISLNLNVETILSNNFAEFSNKVKSATKSIILEVHVADMFADMYAFKMSQELAQSFGYRICLDGLTNLSFIHVDRGSLGFDLAKLLWNADMEGDLGTEENQKLAAAIKRCGSNRMILCRCDTHHAIDYGKALGISLFQGRFPDRVINPDATIVN
jgi:hypothetical protein